MDPITAWAQAVKAIAEMATEAMRGQSVEDRQKMWAWFVADIERMRKALGLD
jgi:hypothetical protein